MRDDVAGLEQRQQLRHARERLADVDHHREAERPCDLLRAAQRVEVALAGHVAREPGLHADDSVAVAEDRVARERHVGPRQVHESPSSITPARDRLMSTRTRLGACFANATTLSIWSAPRDPASTSDVTPCDRQIDGISAERTCVCTSTRPGMTRAPEASSTSAAAEAGIDGRRAVMRPPLMPHVGGGVEALRRIDDTAALDDQVELGGG